MRLAKKKWDGQMRWERVVAASLMADVTVNDLQYGFMQKQMQFALRELMENH